MPQIPCSRRLVPATLGAVCLFTVAGGCSHPLEVDVPANVHGHVVVLCESFVSTATPIHVGENGQAEHAACPRSQTSLVVVRGGQPVKPVNLPQWEKTGDGILLAVEFDLP